MKTRATFGLAAAVLLILAGCSAVSPVSSGGKTAPVPSPASSSTQAPPMTETSSPLPAATSSGAEVITAGVVLPNAARTPGALNPAVTQADVRSTICVSGWTSTIRPPSSVTTALKEQQLASGYAYKGDMATADYEEDHLISLEIGGAPSSAANLWPEPYTSPDGARTKDLIENKLHTLVCAGTMQLATAQHLIATNWWTAYETYDVGKSSVSTAPRTAPVAPVVPAAPKPAPGAGATALCRDGTYSYAAHHQGACSRHGGVATFYK